MRILIVEDEAVIARRLGRLCKEILGKELTLLKTLSRLDEAHTFLTSEPVDVVLLDLNLNGEDGFELLKHMVAGAFHTIVVSARKDQALRAFEFGVVDFVAKPFDKARLVKSFDRLRPGGEGWSQTRFLAVRKPGKVELVPVKEILYLRGAGPYTQLVLRSGQEELHHKSLDRLLTVLPDGFVRIHKSYVAHMLYARRLLVHPGSRYELELVEEMLLPVGRTRVKALRERLATLGS